ncbi:ParA family protein [Patescibacteria group bacterium]|nr:ParA family protein [Patescibacteria group bacterium]
MARVIAVCNQKGGVGKTTTSVNLGAYLAAFGKRVLLIDFDPQANATSALTQGVSGKSIYNGILGDAHYEELIRPTQILNYQIISSSSDLSGSLIELVGLPEREYFLRKFINNIRHKYDYILIDLPPSLSLLTVNGLVAADEILIPVQAEYYGMEGLGQLLRTVDLIRENLKHPIKITGALITLYDKRERLPRQVAKNLRRNFPHRVFEVEIPRSIHLAEAPSFSQPILIYNPSSSGALAYRRLAEEVIGLESEFIPPTQFGDFNV